MMLYIALKGSTLSLTLSLTLSFNFNFKMNSGFNLNFDFKIQFILRVAKPPTGMCLDKLKCAEKNLV